MTLTKIPSTMLQGGGSGGGTGDAVVVEGFDMAAINAAKIAAGDGGTLFFPAGAYTIDGLTADFDSQEWHFERGAILTRSASSLAHGINVTGNGLTLKGDFVLDMNRALNSSTDWQGINANPAYLTIDGDNWELKNCPYVGINVHEEKLRIRGGKISNTGYMGVYWVTTAAANREAPTIEDLIVDRRTGWVVGGGIIINGGPGGTQSTGADVRNCKVYLPQLLTVPDRDAAYASVAIEVNRCQHVNASNNYVNGGRIGVSFAAVDAGDMIGNRGVVIGDYLCEMADCNFCIMQGNTGSGSGPGVAHYGISISGNSAGGNIITGNATKILFGASINDVQTVSYANVKANNV